MSADIENHPPPSRSACPTTKVDRQFAAILLAGLPVDLPGKKYDDARRWAERMFCEARELANGVHRMKRREDGSRYWDCVKCKQFLCDIMSRARTRITARIAARALGPCPGKPATP